MRDDEESEDQLGEVLGIASKRQVVPLIIFFDLIMFLFLIITVSLIGYLVLLTLYLAYK
jgi:hypothetical protein